MALNCSLFEKIAFFVGSRQTDKQTNRRNRWTEPMRKGALAVASSALTVLNNFATTVNKFDTKVWKFQTLCRIYRDMDSDEDFKWPSNFEKEAISVNVSKNYTQLFLTYIICYIKCNIIGRWFIVRYKMLYGPRTGFCRRDSTVR